MKLRVLVDNNTIIDKYFVGEPALCFYIEEDERKILFDTGYSDVFLKNAEDMGIDLSEIADVVISHGHNDHTGGMEYLLNKNFKSKPRVVSHPMTFIEREADGLSIGSPVNKIDVENKFKMILTKEPTNITDRLIFLGEIPTTHDFEKRKVVGKCLVDDLWEDDYVCDDSALVYKGKEGIYIITGCSHSGICNIISYARKVTGIDKVLGVIGGFHLFEKDDLTMKTIEYIKNTEIKEIYPCHCTAFGVKAEMSKHMDIKEIGVSTELEWR